MNLRFCLILPQTHLNYFKTQLPSYPFSLLIVTLYTLKTEDQDHTMPVTRGVIYFVKMTIVGARAELILYIVCRV